MNASQYIVITPVRNEEQYLPLTIQSMASQMVRPLRWVIVNDGSSDHTGRLADEAAREHDWIKVVQRSDRGYRQAGGGVIEAFYAGYNLIAEMPRDFLVKLDGDLSFEEAYFAQCFDRFASNPRLGIGGGTISNLVNGQPKPESTVDPAFHVRGATKIYRAACWRDIGGLIQAPGWDSVDEVKANMHGWVTATFTDVPIVHHRQAGAADGTWKNWVKGGLGNYITGYHPLFMILKCLRRLCERPYLVAGAGLFVGFVSGYLKKVPQLDDGKVIAYLRRQQMNRLLGRKSLWGDGFLGDKTLRH